MKVKTRFSLLLSLFLLFAAVSSFAAGITFYLSNFETSVNVNSSILTLNVGYPYSSLRIGENYYAQLMFRESTPVFYMKMGLKVWKNAFFSLSLGAKTKIGKISYPLCTQKISEVGRNYIWAEMAIHEENLKASFSYSRFFSSIAKNLSKGIFFLSPPNSNGEEVNAVMMGTAYSFLLQKGFRLSLLANGTFYFSDAFIFKSPIFEFGISLSTDLKELQENF